MSFEKKLQNEEGASAVEYGLLIAIIAIAVAVALLGFRGTIAGAFTGADACIQNPSSAACVNTP